MRIRRKTFVADGRRLLVILILLLIGVLNLASVVNKKEMEKGSIEQLLKIAMQPVGSTMYIWGGGWNTEDSGAGFSSTQIGLSPQWKAFAENQTADYDYKKHRYEREKGLDCSGYVGWVLYNTFEKSSGLPGYVTTSTNMAESLVKRGWGKVIKNPKEFLPGDIVSMEGHVWLCMGTCEDGSVLLVHSSPPGVSICGTEGIAVQLATDYMEKYHSKWQEKYPNRKVSLAYLKNVKVFRWNTNVMNDTEEFQEKSAEEIMILLSSDM